MLGLGRKGVSVECASVRKGRQVYGWIAVSLERKGISWECVRMIKYSQVY